MKKILCAALLAFAVALPARAADAAGDWKVDGNIGGQFPVDLVCSLKEADKKLTGSCKGNEFPELPITGESDGTTVKWSYNVTFQGQELTVLYTATMDSDTAMKGTISVMGQESGAFTAKKQ